MIPLLPKGKLMPHLRSPVLAGTCVAAVFGSGLARPARAAAPAMIAVDGGRIDGRLTDSGVRGYANGGGWPDRKSGDGEGALRQRFRERLPSDEERAGRTQRTRALQNDQRWGDRSDRRFASDRTGSCRNPAGDFDRVKAGLTADMFDQTVALHPTMAEELVLMN